jgi:hypothetical protein
MIFVSLSVKEKKEPEVIAWTTWDGAGHFANISEQWLLQETRNVPYIN